MKFDTIIIGGGLSGLISGIRLSQQGQHCVIISSGQSALHFSSGSFDLLNALPDGTPVTKPLSSIKELIKQSPLHPYTKLGNDNFEKLAQKAESFLSEIGIQTQGNAQKNHYRVTPMGNLSPTWLTMSDLTVSSSANELPWKKISILNVTGFLDFYPQFIADEFKKIGTESEIHEFDLPDLEYIRRNPSELRSPNIARVIDKKENLDKLVDILRTVSVNSDAIILPSIIGMYGTETIDQLKKAINKPIHLIATMPPSVTGIRIQKHLHDYFIRQGGAYMLGDTIQRADIEKNRITKVYSYNHGDIPFTADNIVLTTGSYFSQGLIASQDRVYEPIFDLDVSYSADRQEWYNTNMFEIQGYQEFGVKTDNNFRGLVNNELVNNLYVSGAILEGFNPIKEGCGAGVSILSALHIANSILNKQ